MKIAVACDHGGLNLKKAVIAYLEKYGHEAVVYQQMVKKLASYKTLTGKKKAAKANPKKYGIIYT